MSKQTKLSTNEKNVIRFTNQLTSIIGLHNITREKLFSDIELLKNDDMESSVFINKYPELFDNNIAYFGKKAYIQLQKKEIKQNEYNEKAINSFLGSFRRNVNPKIFKRVSIKKYKNFNSDLRDFTITNYEITTIKEQKAKKHLQKQKAYIKRYGKFESKIIYDGIALDKINKLENVQDLKFVKEHEPKLFTYQEVNYKINFNLYKLEIYKRNKKSLTRKVYLVKNQWLTFSSNISSTMDLNELSDFALNVFDDYLNNIQQSEIHIEIIKAHTYILRVAE